MEEMLFPGMKRRIHDDIAIASLSFHLFGERGFQKVLPKDNVAAFPEFLIEIPEQFIGMKLYLTSLQVLLQDPKHRPSSTMGFKDIASIPGDRIPLENTSGQRVWRWKKIGCILTPNIDFNNGTNGK